MAELLTNAVSSTANDDAAALLRRRSNHNSKNKPLRNQRPVASIDANICYPAVLLPNKRHISSLSSINNDNTNWQSVMGLMGSSEKADKRSIVSLFQEQMNDGMIPSFSTNGENATTQYYDYRHHKYYAAVISKLKHFASQFFKWVNNTISQFHRHGRKPRVTTYVVEFTPKNMHP
mmetsp:Transcript_3246/g.9231  ORF Transcript_3246/g.9231 Transcript_3246/m.9231 type:complete len:176 (+) Transcript_3246:773-1300(+)|eukprot:CAMPEP_0119558854 /NCGR_PEP_ID=MMETSP1352-20130426/11388_1 /TAXON_ID=265584 /ORGANISM="Stauroneis constricta, Strain CCMP1120" /LENGTH=175 /DNA_ID=CAMNT_0007606337 /DNA_START=236 /DNA_END=763 /DNA_ORIENTATION=-